MVPKPEFGGGPVKFEEIGVQERIAAGERNLPAHPPLPAKIVQLPQDLQPLGQGGNCPGAAVIAVPAVQVAGLGQMPLQSEYLGGVKFVRNFHSGGKAGRVTAEGRGRGQNQAPPAGLSEGGVDMGEGNSGCLGRGFR